MSNRAGKIFAALCLAVGVTIATQIPRWSERIAQHFDAKTPSQGEVAKILKLDGKVSVRDFSENRFHEAFEGAGLANLTTIQVQARSRVELEFPSGYRLNFPDHSLAVLELHDSADASSPLYLHMLAGRPELLKEGTAGKLYVMIDKRLLDPKGASVATTKELVISPLLVEGTSIVAQAPSETVTPTESGTTAGPDTDPGSGTLTNEYIDEMIAQQAEQFQRCQSNTIRSRGEAKGKMLIGLTISPQGKMDEARILTSDIQDEAMQKCVIEVFSRVKLKAFTGSPIVRSYPLNFE